VQEILDNLEDVREILLIGRMPTVSRCVTSFKDCLKAFSADPTYVSRFLQRLQLLSKTADISHLVENDHVDNSSQSHHRQASAVVRHRRVYLMNHRTYLVRELWKPRRESAVDPRRIEGEI
jgi:hypothetical protein